MLALVALIVIPAGILMALVIYKSAIIQKQLHTLENKQKKLLEINKILAIEKGELLQKQYNLKSALEKTLQSNQFKQSKLEEHDERLKEFHSIRFTRTSGWGSPAYTISVDAMGQVLYEGVAAMRKIGFFKWQIYRKRIQNLNHVIQKAQFFEIEETTFKSSIDEISGVEIEIFLKDGTHRTVTYDHASKYPIELGFLERKLDRILGTKNLWLYWSQKIVHLSLKKGQYYRTMFLKEQGIVYAIKGREFVSLEYLQAWGTIDDILDEFGTDWAEETKLSNRSHPQNSIWIELETGFKFIIYPDKHPQVYQAMLHAIQSYGEYIRNIIEQQQKNPPPNDTDNLN